MKLPNAKFTVEKQHKNRSFLAQLVTLLLVTTFLSSNGLVFAGDAFGGASNLFAVGAGARSMAMGSAFTAVSDDASASYFNPAGLAFMDEHQLMIMHAPLFMDSNYNYFSSANPLGDKWGSFALSDALLLSNKFEVRDANNILQQSNASLTNNAIYGSYAHKITQKLSAGGNVKFIQQKIVNYSDNAMGLDLGLLYRPAPLFSLGASVANINSPEIHLKDDTDTYKPLTRVGVASQLFDGKFLFSADASRLSQESTRYAAGIEYLPIKLLSLRTGFNVNHSYTLGMGLNLKTLRFDYAFSDTDVGTFNKVSLTWAWHNIYKTDIAPPMEGGRAVYPLSGFENQVAFKTTVPSQFVARWSLRITDSEGKEVRTLQGDLRPPETIVWDAKNAVGEPVVSGVYKYNFTVQYKNGKTWTNTGDLNLDLPSRQTGGSTDMNMQLNGAKQSELNDAPAAQQPQQVQPQTPPQQNAAPAPMQPASTETNTAPATPAAPQESAPSTAPAQK